MLAHKRGPEVYSGKFDLRIEFFFSVENAAPFSALVNNFVAALRGTLFSENARLRVVAASVRGSAGSDCIVLKITPGRP